MEKRLLLVFTFFLLIFVLILIRLFYWQILSTDSLVGLSKLQLAREENINAKRGEIIASDGSPLVINQPLYIVYSQPHEIKDKKKTIEHLSKLLSLDTATVSAKLSDENAKWISIAEKVDSETVDKIRKENLEGIGFSDDNSRYYPESSMAAHILGFVGKNHNGEPQGYFGLEGYYNEQLKGRSGFITEEKDALGNPIMAGKRQIVRAEDGRNLHLTVDKSVQYIIEQKLKDGIEKYGAKSGSVIVMNPKNGEIIGLASLPSYDPYKRLEFSEDLYKNPAISSSYEPGSTFKILVMAAAVNENSISPNDVFDETGPIEMGKYTIKTWNQEYHGKIRIPEILQYSSNVGMVYIMEKLGTDKLITYLKSLGLGSLTGIDLQDEATPDIRPEKEWYPIDYATASFGQGIAVTPLQMIRMASSIANGGNLVVPHIVDRITDNKGKSIKIAPKVERNVFKKETSRIVTEMMVQAIEKGETKFLKPVGIKIAGKTGTAQIPISGHYDAQKTIASFVGFFPAENPQIIMLVTLREPTSSVWGSETAAPLFFSITKELISYYNIPLNF